MVSPRTILLSFISDLATYYSHPAPDSQYIVVVVYFVIYCLNSLIHVKLGTWTPKCSQSSGIPFYDVFWISLHSWQCIFFPSLLRDSLDQAIFRLALSMTSAWMFSCLLKEPKFHGNISQLRSRIFFSPGKSLTIIIIYSDYRSNTLQIIRGPHYTYISWSCIINQS